MPGSIVRATCGCGYEKELYPGASELFSGQVFSIAYNQFGDEIDTFDDEIIDQEKLLKMEDPGLEDPPFSEARPIICPSCKNLSLLLYLVGNWD